MRTPLLILASLVVFLSPRPALACTCEIRDQNLTNRLRNSAAVFIGTTLGKRQVTPWVPGSRPPVVEYTFIVNEGWKSPDREVVRVTRDDLCGGFVVGRTYLVFADSGSAGLAISPCALPSPDLNPEWPRAADRNWRLKLRAMLDSLGPPAWSAPPPSERDLARLNRAVFGDSTSLIDILFVSDSVLGRPTSDRFSVELLRTNHRAMMDASGFFVLNGVRPGLYVARVRYPTGIYDDQYVWLRCKPEVATHCSAGGTLFSQRGRVR